MRGKGVTREINRLSEVIKSAHFFSPVVVWRKTILHSCFAMVEDEFLFFLDRCRIEKWEDVAAIAAAKVD